jgi:hypothetical protein
VPVDPQPPNPLGWIISKLYHSLTTAQEAETRLTSAEALAIIGDEPDVEKALCYALLCDKDPKVRERAAKALAEIEIAKAKAKAEDSLLRKFVEELVRDVQNRGSEPGAEAEEILQANVTSIQQQEPQRWDLLKKYFLNPEKWFTGSTAAIEVLIKEYTQDSAIRKAITTFLSKISEQEQE